MPFKKGQSGNPGRVNDKPFRDALMMEIKAAGKDRKSLRELARALIDEAASGNVAAIREVADRLDGKVPPAKDDSGTREGAHTVTIVRLSDLVAYGRVTLPSDVDAETLSGRA